jgi:hypothetical protein
MTEQEWLEGFADQQMRGRNITPAFSPDLPAVSECGWRVVLAPLPPLNASTLYQRIRHADEVEFYAVFDGREVTTRRPMDGLSRSVPAAR